MRPLPNYFGHFLSLAVSAMSLVRNLYSNNYYKSTSYDNNGNTRSYWKKTFSVTATRSTTPSIFVSHPGSLQFTVKTYIYNYSHSAHPDSHYIPDD